MNARTLIFGMSCASLLLPCATAIKANEKDEPVRQVDLRARVTGYVTKVNFKEGDSVKKGDVLFEIDDRVHRAQLQVTEEQVRGAEARVQVSAANLRRAENLFKNKTISGEEFDKCAADRAVAEAELQVAKATLKLGHVNLDYTKVFAPINGRIGQALITEGNLVKADDTHLATIISGREPLPPPKKAAASDALKRLLKERQKVLAEDRKSVV